jgi:hypothetical protein
MPVISATQEADRRFVVQDHPGEKHKTLSEKYLEQKLGMAQMKGLPSNLEALSLGSQYWRKKK